MHSNNLPHPRSPFKLPLQKALEQFLPKWDANKNDRLDRSETAALLRDGSIRSIEAATLATSHFWFLKSPDKNLQPLTS